MVILELGRTVRAFRYERQTRMPTPERGEVRAAANGPRVALAPIAEPSRR